MGKIHVLPETVQNKIAAGEVVERPSSVVKELVENSLDAGASSVTVEIEEGGHRLIRVSDDGQGMDETDLVSAMQRHATSKIAVVEDIFRISSFGFRGEALPSIGSVSRLSIVTALPAAAAGNELRVEGGELVRLSPAPPRKGTRIEVRDIFYNTPARRKFLKSAASEAGQTLAVVTRLALGNPGVAFSFRNGERIVLSVRPAATQLERIRDIFGRDLADRMLPFERGVNEGLAFSGFVARPPESNRNAGFIYLLVNNRWIRSLGLFRALAEAFRGAIEPRCYPKAVVNVMVDPARIDINVHPTKEEIRFDDERRLIGEVTRAARAAIGQAAGVSTFQSVARRPAADGERTGGPGGAPIPPDRRLHPDAGAGQGRLGLKSTFGGGFRREMERLDLSAAREYLRRSGGRDAAPVGTGTMAAAAAVPAPSPRANPREGAPPPADGTDAGAPGRHRVLGQAGGKYILVDSPDGLLLVDPHALHERWNYDRLMAERSGNNAGKTLLLPLEFALSPAESEAAAEATAELAEYGFAFETPGPDRIRIAAIPSFLSAAKAELLVRQVLSDSGETGAEAAIEGMRERVLASLACRSSVLMGKTLPEEEMLALLDAFFNQGQLPVCPHGRPTAIRLSWSELDRRFGR